MTLPATSVGRLSSLIPALGWLRGYRPSWFRSDLVAVTGLFKWSALKQIWKFSRAEFSVAATTLLGFPRGIAFRLSEAHSGVRETLRRAGFEKFYGPIVPDQTVSTVLAQHLLSHDKPETR